MVDTPQGFDFENHKYEIPSKKIVELGHVQVFQKSDSCKELEVFIIALANKCKSSKMTET